MKKSVLIIASFLLATGIMTVSADTDLSQKLAGRILLQVEAHGEAWYVNPADAKRYFLGRPNDAFGLMRRFGTGISDNDLHRLPVGFADYTEDDDDDKDGLSNRFEEALGCDPLKADTDGDGYGDKLEIENGYDPASGGRMDIDRDFACTQAGRIFLAVENRGQAWYVNPDDCRRYYLGRPADAFLIMKDLGLGISDADLEKILPSVSLLTPPPPGPATTTPPVSPPSNPDCGQADPDQVMSLAGAAVRSGNKDAATDCFVPGMKKAIEYTLDYLDADGRLTLGNILSGAALTASTDDSRTYSLEVYFSLGGYKVPVEFNLKKQPDGSWLIANL